MLSIYATLTHRFHQTSETTNKLAKTHPELQLQHEQAIAAQANLHELISQFSQQISVSVASFKEQGENLERVAFQQPEWWDTVDLFSPLSFCPGFEGLDEEAREYHNRDEHNDAEWAKEHWHREIVFARMVAGVQRVAWALHLLQTHAYAEYKMNVYRAIDSKLSRELVELVFHQVLAVEQIPEQPAIFQAPKPGRREFWEHLGVVYRIFR
ncbi:hypothetical protein BU23DRAFT_627985 [Bimuria novae-zelandiae CBS 107.79]|uniref:Uncharacterized protein n=1 Tax=Bimuria novae-zelandiae CBS 107.79 TaxID=1447943 RepID=A0A6A5VHH2_9PLEO|nr:hypothetical protein BU23DRAFT_627985 [Bimuria novae-zelandiae CBS 107.79]